MKVLWIASWFPSVQFPFNGDFVERMGRAVSDHSEIYLIHVQEGPIKEVDVFEEFDDYFRVIITVPKSQRWNYFFRFLNLYRGIKKGIKIIKDKGINPEVVHLHVIYPLGIFCLFDSFLRSKQLVITEHWTRFRHVNKDKLPSVAKWIGILATRKAHSILTVNKYLSNDMQQYGMKGNYQVIPNVVDCTLFKPGEKKNQKEFTFLHVSTLTDSVKNVSGIIMAFNKVLKKNGHIKLQLIGDGDDRHKHEKTVQILGITDSVDFMGEMPHTAVASAMQKADCLVHFSNYENLPCVILEAMATGLSIIATETGGIGDWVDEDVGILVHPRDEEGLTNAMQKILSNVYKYDPKKIREKVLLKCSREVIGEKIANVYKSLF
ncbi:MAG: glycosyltransferase [Bacteroidota bacterium]